MLIDPKPYTYEYRKPRYSNPTLYQFTHLASLVISTKASTTVIPPNLMTTLLPRNALYIPPLKNYKRLTPILKSISSFNATFPKSETEGLHKMLTTKILNQ